MCLGTLPVFSCCLVYILRSELSQWCPSTVKKNLFHWLFLIVSLIIPSYSQLFRFGKKMAFARAMAILCSLVIWFSRKLRGWMVLFRSLLDQFVSNLDRANRLSIFQFDAVWFIDFSAKDFDRWVQWTRDSCIVLNFWKSEIKIYVGLDAFIVSILSFETRRLISASSAV